jgi:hypothetical protein
MRDAIKGSGETPYAICKALDINRSMLSRLLSGKAGLTSSTMDKVLAHLGLDVAVIPRAGERQLGMPSNNGGRLRARR